jgi:choline dehydrogenase-like flavoprotein
MATEPADVLIIGAGASGGVVAKRLAEAGFGVVCLEQGDWLDRADYPGNKLDWELKARKDWATSPNIRGLAGDYPIVEDDTPVSPLMYNAVGGSTIIFAGAWPRALPSDFRVRSLDGVADDWPIDYFELLPYFYRTDRDFGVSGLPGDPAYPPDTEDAPMPPLPIGSAGLKVARGMTKLGWHWWPEFNSINSVAYDGRRPCVQRSTCQSGCNEGAKASTDLTHWPKAISMGARLVTGARVRRIETDASGLATGATWIDRDGAEHFEPARVVVLAANAIGTPRLLLLSASPAHPDGLANSSGLVGRRYMAHLATMMQGFHPFRKNPTVFQKTVAINDFYLRGPRTPYPLGSIQSQGRTHGVMAQTVVPSIPVWAYDAWVARGVDWLAMSEDLPRPENRVTIAPDGRIRLEYHANNVGAHRELVAEVIRMLRKLGFWKVMTHSHKAQNTTHQCGTLVFGRESRTSVLDPFCRTHDVENLFVVDASFFPSSAAVNPGLTIAAQALRVADHIRRHDLRVEAEPLGLGRKVQ